MKRRDYFEGKQLSFTLSLNPIKDWLPAKCDTCQKCYMGYICTETRKCDTLSKGAVIQLVQI